MKWTVVWHPAAADALAEIWLRAVDRNDVTRATDAIDRALGDDPDRKGVEFYGDRLYDEAPLSVVFRLSAPDCLVTVLDVAHH